MMSVSTWFRYVVSKLEYSVSVSWKIRKCSTNYAVDDMCVLVRSCYQPIMYEVSTKGAHKGPITLSRNYKGGQINDTQIGDVVWKNLFQGKLTYLHWNKGEEMAPVVGNRGGTLLVRKIPMPDTNRVFVGDVVVLKDPEKPDDYMVRRLAAVEGYEMVSTDEKDEPFIIEEHQCWVLSDNENLKPKEAKDSRSFGPVLMSSIVGRAIYCLRTAVDHGPIRNSSLSMKKDSPVLEVELDVEELAKNHKA